MRAWRLPLLQQPPECPPCLDAPPHSLPIPKPPQEFKNEVHSLRTEAGEAEAAARERAAQLQLSQQRAAELEAALRSTEQALKKSDKERRRLQEGGGELEALLQRAEEANQHLRAEMKVRRACAL